MDLTVNPKSLAAALAAAAGATERRTSMPVLSCALLTASAARLAVTATDLELTLSTAVDAEVSDTGRVCVPAVKLLAVARDLPGDKVRLVADYETNSLDVLAGFFSANIPGLPPDDFPSAPEAGTAEAITVQAEDLAAWLAALAPSISQEDTRFNLCGAHFSRVGGKLRLQSTDGHRATRWDLNRDAPAWPKDKDGLILPRKAALVLAKLAAAHGGEASLTLDEHLVSARLGDTTLLCRTVEGRFPDVDVVIPQKTKRSAVVNRQALAAAVGRVAHLTAKDYRGLRLDLAEDEVRLAAVNTEGRAHDKIEATVTGEDLSVGLQDRYLLDLCGVMKSEEISLAFVDEVHPVKVTGQGDPGLLIVVMPMRL